MDETMKNAATEELNEQETLVVEEETVTTEQDAETDPIKEVIEERLRTVQRQAMLLGAQTMCSVIRQKIYKFESQSGRRTMNDYKRFMKDVKNFCDTGLSRKVNADGETEPIKEESAVEETVQN